MGAPKKTIRRNLWRHQPDSAAKNEQLVEECLKKIHAQKDPEESLRELLQFLGEALQCDRVYVFEEMDRRHIRNTYEWCRKGIPSGIEELPYVAKKDLFPWDALMAEGKNITEPNVDGLWRDEPLIYGLLHPQGIRSIVLSPLFSQGRMVGLLGADNPPPDKMGHISVLFDVLAYFVCSLICQRELKRLREARNAVPKVQGERVVIAPRFEGKTILLVDDSPELLKCNERVLRPEGYTVRTAKTIKGAKKILEQEKMDAIVLDIDLSDGSGLEFCRRLRGSADIPVVFLTAHSDAQTAREGFAAGGCGFLTKPYQLEELRNMVAAAVEGKLGNSLMG